MLSNRLGGKVALVTGIGSGIGQGCGLMFARHGAQVMGCDIDPSTAEHSLALAAKENLPITSVHPCDLTNPADVQRLLDATVKRYGGIDILLNAAAFGAFAWIQDMDYTTQWKATLTGELDVVFLACKAAWPHLIRRGGGFHHQFRVRECVCGLGRIASARALRGQGRCACHDPATGDGGGAARHATRTRYRRE